MFEITRGNLLSADTDALVNTVNCVGVMGKGIALQFKQAFPQNFRAYEQACRRKEMRPGMVLVVPTMHVGNPKYIINFPTKVHWRGKSRLEYIDTGLVALVREIERLGIRSIAIPPLGCGNGGLNWADVEPRILEAFTQLPDVRALVFEPDGAPATDQMEVRTQKPVLTMARALLLRLLASYREGGYRSSLLEVQKLAYFLQAAGEPLRLEYMRHKYGPYAENLNFVLQRLEGHYLRGYGDRTRRAEIRLLSGAADAAREYLAGSADALDRLCRVERLIEGFESPYGLELLATVHWVVAHDPTLADDEAAVVERVREWSQRKGELFTPRHITVAWERLRREGWLPDPTRRTAQAS